MIVDQYYEVQFNYSHGWEKVLIWGKVRFDTKEEAKKAINVSIENGFFNKGYLAHLKIVKIIAYLENSQDIENLPALKENS